MSSPDVSNKERSNQAPTLFSHQLVFLENASPSKCTTRPSTKLDQVTTLVLTSRDFQKRTCLKLDVMSVENADGDDDPPKAAETFRAAVFVQDHPGQLKAASADGKGGFSPSIHVRTAKAPCQLMKILWKRGKSTSNVKVEDPTFIEAGDEAEVIFKPKLPLCVDAYDVCKPLGRMAAMDSNSLIMLGRVLEATKKKDDK